MEYHVTNQQSHTTTDYSTFSAALTAVGNVTDQIDTFLFVFDGDRAADAQPYSLTTGEDGTGWFTDYSDDSPNHQTWANVDAAKTHMRHIDDTAWGRI